MFSKWKFRLTTITPLHIGGPRALTQADYVTWANRVYVVSEEMLFKFLQERGLADRFVTEFHSLVVQRHPSPVKEFLQRRGLCNEMALQAISQYACERTTGTEVTGEVRTFVRDAHAQPLLPGSSLKGAIRTVVLYHLAKQLRDARPTEFERLVLVPLREALKNRKPRKWVDDAIERNLLTAFQLDHAQLNSHKDFLRVLRIGDSQPLDRNALVITKATVKSSSQSGNWYDKTNVLVETTPKGTSFEHVCSIDEWLAEQFQRQNRSVPSLTPDQLMNMVREFHGDLVQQDRELYDFVQKSQPLPAPAGDCVLHLGWGSGLLGTTIVGLLPPELRLEVRGQYFQERDLPMFPKSRRVTEHGEPFGWVRLEVV
jgi:CRISPR-associated protein Csm5